MVEEIQKIKIEELTRIRLLLPTGLVHEMSLGQIGQFKLPGVDPQTMAELQTLQMSLQLLSSDQRTSVKVEFLIPNPQPEP